MIRKYGEIILTGALVWLAAVVMVGVVQVQAVTSPGGRGVDGDGEWVQGTAGQGSQLGVYLVAQKTEKKEVKPAAPAPAPEEPQIHRKRAAPPAQMEREDGKSAGFGDEMERAGTKKLGGQPIRAKED